MKRNQNSIELLDEWIKDMDVDGRQHNYEFFPNDVISLIAIFEQAREESKSDAKKECVKIIKKTFKERLSRR